MTSLFCTYISTLLEEEIMSLTAILKFPVHHKISGRTTDHSPSPSQYSSPTRNSGHGDVIGLHLFSPPLADVFDRDWSDPVS